MTEIAMPQLSDSMEEGTILKWLVSVGDSVVRGQPLAEVETDKANETYESPESGVISELVAAEGDTLSVGAVIARFAPDGAEPAARGPSTATSPVDDPMVAEPEPPAARDAEGIKGEVTVVEPTPAQRTVARRMAESKATAPDFQLAVEVDMSACVRLRDRLHELAAGSEDEVEPTYNDMVVKACAQALRDSPRVNAAYRDGRFELYSRVNVGVAVAADDALVVPTIFEADGKSLGQIARETSALAQKVRDGRITAPEVAGATFTISNLGMYGIERFSAIVNPPQAAVLAVGSIEKRPRADERGRVTARETMIATLSCDQRILYGADGARFLARVRELLEDPVSLTL